MIDRWSRSDLVGYRVYHLLDLELGGRVYRFATEALDIDDADGVATHYTAGLDSPRFAEELHRREPSVSIRIIDPSTNWAQVILGDGHDITTATATLSQWRAGLTLGQRRLLVSGQLDEPVFGAIGEALAFSIVLDAVEDTALVCDPDRQTNGTTWPILGDGHITVDWQSQKLVGGSDVTATGTATYPIDTTGWQAGQYPRVFGVPGARLYEAAVDSVLTTSNAAVAAVGSTTSSSLIVGLGSIFIPGSPAPAVAYLPSDASPRYYANEVGSTLTFRDWVRYYVIVADRPIKATTAYIRNMADPTSTWQATAVVQLTDGLGTVVSAARIGNTSSASTWVADPTDGATDFDLDGDYWVGWLTDGGELDDLGDNAITGAGDILLRLLDETSLGVDRGRAVAVINRLNGYKLAGYTVDTEQTVVDFITRELVPILPIALRQGPSGLYPVYLDPAPSSRDAVAHLDAADEGIERADLLALLSRPINDVTVQYLLDPTSDEHRGSVIAHGNPDRLAIADNAINPGFGGQSVTLQARLSHARYRRQSHVVATDWIHDRATAEVVAADIVDDRAMPHLEISYQTRTVWGWLEPGNIVTVTDAEIGLTSEVARVEAIEWIGDHAITLRLRVDQQLRQR